MEVNSSIEEVNAVTRKVTVSIAAQDVKNEVENEIGKLVKTATMKGFRPGKAPRQLVEKLHGERVRVEVADHLVSRSLADIAKEKDLDIVGTPSIELKSFEAGGNLEFVATMEIFPRPEVKDYEKFNVRVARHEAKDGDVDQVLERMRGARASLKKLELRNIARNGDVVDATIQIKISGENAPGRAEPQTFELGKGRLPADVEQGMVDMEVGQTREINSHIPDDYRDAALRGKEALYIVTINSLSERVLPELNDEFAKSAGAGAETLLELRMKIRTSLDEENTRRAETDTEAAILDELVKSNVFDVPQALIDDEIRSLVARTGLIDNRKVDLSRMPVDQFREGLGEVAIKRVRSAILVDRIAEKDNLKASEEEFSTRIRELAAENHVSEQEVKKFLSESGRAFSLMLDITRNKVMKHLRDRTQVEYYAADEKPAEEQA